MTAAALASETFSTLAAAPTVRSHIQFQLLTTERQLTLDGRAEPLSAPAADAFHARADAAEPQDSYEAQASLFGWPQAEMPLHPLVDGKIHPDCLRGYRSKSDAHALDNGAAVHVVPECCGLQRCQCSKASNDSERARDLWNGTKRKKGKGERIGLRHVSGEAALGVLVVTAPPKLRPSAADAKVVLKQWERAVYEALRATLRELVGCPDAEFYVRANIHPCGENAQQWKPHLNFMVAGWYFSPSLGRAKRFKPWMNLDPAGPLKTALTAAQSAVFGGEERAQCFWQYEQDEAGKRHQAIYVPRTFPEWAHLGLRPTGYGLATAKGRPVLVEALDTLSMKALPQWVTVELRDGLEPAPISGSGSTESKALQDNARQLMAHRRVCGHCIAAGLSDYPEHRRTKTDSGVARGSEPPGERPETGPDPASVLKWRQFLSLPA